MPLTEVESTAVVHICNIQTNFLLDRESNKSPARMGDMETIHEMNEEDANNKKDCPKATKSAKMNHVTASTSDTTTAHGQEVAIPRLSPVIPVSTTCDLDDMEEGQVVQIIRSNKNCKTALSSATCVSVTATNHIYLGNTVSGGFSVFSECGSSLMELSTLSNLVSGDVSNIKMAVNGNIIITASSNTGTVLEKDRGVMARAFDLKGKLLHSYLHPAKDSKKAKRGSKELDKCIPHGLAVTSDNRLIVTDIGNHSVFIYDEDQTLVKKFGKKGTNKYAFRYPYYAAVNDQDDIYISDYGNHCIKVYNKHAKYLFEFGNCGRKIGQLVHPMSICVDRHDNIVVADRDNHRIQLFSSTGHPLMVILPDTRDCGWDTRPIDVAMSPKGHLVALIKGVPGVTQGRIETLCYKPKRQPQQDTSKTCTIL